MGKERGEILMKMYERMIKCFIDILVLSELRNGNALSGYDVITFIHNRFRLLVSSGIVYSLLYSMERDGLIEGSWDQRKRVYTLTTKGEKTIEVILNANEKILYFMKKVLSR